MAGKAKALFLAVEHPFPLLAVQLLAGCQPRLRMKPRIAAIGGVVGDLLHDRRRLQHVAAEKIEAARATKLHTLAFLRGQDIGDQLRPVVVGITLRDHAAWRPEWPRPVPRIAPVAAR